LTLVLADLARLLLLRLLDFRVALLGDVGKLVQQFGSFAGCFLPEAFDEGGCVTHGR